MIIEYDWYLSNENIIIHYISIYKHSFYFDDRYICLIQYFCYCIIYVSIRRLMESLLKEEIN